ncbi:hypothetical protein AHF37_09149 [Paragonimus kellicotti]|nr:hypothetical protein AHF37_09149 [Paragonimus kellicotti]
MRASLPPLPRPLWSAGSKTQEGQLTLTRRPQTLGVMATNSNLLMLWQLSGTQMTRGFMSVFPHPQVILPGALCVSTRREQLNKHSKVNYSRPH